MTCLRAFFVAIAVIALFPSSGNSQIGITFPPLTANTELSCIANAAGTPELRPEGYTEQLGDILIGCTGGPLSTVGATIATATVVVYVVPSVPITSRIVGDNGASEALLLIDEPGANIPTGATGGYGPNAPLTFCTTAQQMTVPSPCTTVVGLDNSQTYQVAVVPGTSTPAQNVYQGKIGDFGPNSVAFYNVPVLPPAYTGISRVFRITNIRIPPAGITGAAETVLSIAPITVLPISTQFYPVGVVGPSMRASVNPARPLGRCVPVPTPTLVSQVTFTEGFPAAFKTRVVPGGASQLTNSPLNTLYEAEAQNLTAPASQTIPGGLYGGYAANSESGLILPAANITVSNITYTAGLTDFGTRLKAVFMHIPVGVSLYVSTTPSGAPPAVPGGMSTAAYAVLVADSQGKEATPDAAMFTPLTSAIAGSDGLPAYPLMPDSNGAAAAIWEVVNADPSRVDSLTFSVYVTYSFTLGAAEADAYLGYSPEPGGGSFSAANGTQGLTNPVPRFSGLWSQSGIWANIGACSLQASTQQISFNYAGRTLPPSQTVPLSAVPSNLPITVTPSVSTPTGGTWLAGAVSGGNLTISVNPTGLAAGSYSGSIKLSATSVSDISIPVSLSVSQRVSALSIVKTHTGDFTPNQQSATYSLSVANDAAAELTQGEVTVTDQIPAGLTLLSMQGTDWDCSTLPSCKRSDQLAPGATWPAITVTVNVDANPPSRVVNQATVFGGGSATALAYDITTTGPLTCTVTGDPAPKVTDVQLLLQEALGIAPAAYDLNSDHAVNIADVQIVANAALGKACTIQ